MRVLLALVAVLSAGCAVEDPPGGWRFPPCPMSEPVGARCTTILFHVADDWTPEDRELVERGVLMWRDAGRDGRISIAPGVAPDGARVVLVRRGETSGPDVLAEVVDGPAIVIAPHVAGDRLRVIAAHEAGHVWMGSGLHHAGQGIMSPAASTDSLSPDDIAWQCETAGVCPLP